VKGDRKIEDSPGGGASHLAPAASSAVVVAIVPDLGPVTLPTGPPLSQTGNVEDPAAIVDAICAALSGR
jgi:hypothetical protein